MEDKDSLNSEEMERQLDAELANMEFNPDDVANVSDEEMSAYNPAFGESHTSFRSMMSGATVMTQNQREINKMVRKNISADDNLDEYLEQLLDIQRKKANKMEKQFQEGNEAWRDFKGGMQKELERVEDQKWKDDLNEIKQINQTEEAIPQDPRSPEKAAIIPKMVLAEEELLEAYKAQEEDRRQWEQEDEQKRIAEAKQQAQSKKLERKVQKKSKIENSVGETELRLEMERMYMEREEKQSKMANDNWHRQRFNQKDMNPPVLPFCLTDDSQPLKNIPVQQNLLATKVQQDSLHRMKVKIKLPRKIQLTLGVEKGEIKVLWSQQMEDLAAEKRKQEEAKRTRQKEHERLTRILQVGDIAVGGNDMLDTSK